MAFDRGKDIVILTGAGISKESGLDTFRDPGGVWDTHRLEDVATPEGFHRDPMKVHAFYNGRRRQLSDGKIVPNAAHAALARLEAEWPGEVLVVTQNVDDLHERAGTRNLIHMHGELNKVRCEFCDWIGVWDRDLSINDTCERCTKTGTLRPQVVWFGEIPLSMPEIYAALEACKLFVSIGTSGNVYPASGFVDHARSFGGAYTVELNLEPSEGSSLFAEAIHGPATEIVPAFVARILEQGWPSGRRT